MKVIFMGTPKFAENVLISLLKIKEIKIIAIFTQPDRKIGRKKIINKSPVKLLAEKENIPIFQPQKISNDFNIIKKLNPDYIITCAFGQIIPQKILNIPKNNINIHASLLPKLRGGAPIHWAIINGFKKTGITIMKMVQKLDAGSIYYQEEIRINDNDTMISLHDKLLELAQKMIEKNIVNILKNKYKEIPQNDDDATYGNNITRNDEKIDFNDNVKRIFNKIRGLYSQPIAYAILNGRIHKIYKASFYKDLKNKNIKNGTICKMDSKGIHVKALNGYIIIEVLQIEGKKPQNTSFYYKNPSLKNINIGQIYE